MLPPLIPEVPPIVPSPSPPLIVRSEGEFGKNGGQASVPPGVGNLSDLPPVQSGTTVTVTHYPASSTPAPPSPASKLPVTTPGAHPGERRRVAILFADLSGSTAMADTLDPETAYTVVSEYLDGLSRVITQEGGYVAKTLGDGLMALFGAPIAHEDDPERACRAALRLQEWMDGFSEAKQRECGVTLRLRVGINYGSVVATALAAGGRPTYDVLGDAVNVAQRTESAADPGSVFVTEPFYRITRRAFEYQERGTRQVKGKQEPLLMYRLVGERAGGAMEELALPLVGRKSEWAAISSAITALQSGKGSLLVVVGAQGMGKSRLTAEILHELAAQGIPYLAGTAPKGSQDSPLLLWRTWLLKLLALDSNMSHAEAADNIRSNFTDPDQAVWAEWLAALAVEPQRLQSLDPLSREMVIRGALRMLLTHWRGLQPAALLVDDAHQLDSFSLQILQEIAAEEETPLLVLLSGQETPSFPPPNAAVIALSPLDEAAVRELLTQALPDFPLTRQLERELSSRSGGSPLFLEMMVREAHRSSNPAAALAEVPDTLYRLVQAQVDALAPEDRGVLQPAAVLGQEFVEEWLTELCEGLNAPKVVQGLEGRELLVEQQPHPERALAFRIGAMRDVVYENLMQSQKHQIHARAAVLLAEAASSKSGLESRVARHWQGAGEHPQALAWLLKAADHATSMHSGTEADGLYREALEIAKACGNLEGVAQASRGLGDMATHRGDFEEAIERYTFARDESERIEQDTPALRVLRASAARSLARVHAQVGALAPAEPLLSAALLLLQDQDDPEAVRERVRCLIEKAHLDNDLGRPEEARLSGVEALQTAEKYGWDFESVAAGSALGLIYPTLGDWPSADRELRRAAGRAEECGDWRGSAACWINLGKGLQVVGRFAEAMACLERALQWTERIHDAEKAAIIQLNMGNIYLNSGKWTSAETAFRAALDKFRPMKHELGVTVTLCNLGDVLRLSGRLAAAKTVLRDAEAALERVEVPSVRAHVALCRAELATAMGDPRSARSLAMKAIEIEGSTEDQQASHSSRLCLGRALRLLGDFTLAADELQKAADGFEAAGEPLDAARARAELAVVLDQQGDHSRAQSLFTDARDCIERLGAQPWLEQLPALGV